MSSAFPFHVVFLRTLPGLQESFGLGREERTCMWSKAGVLYFILDAIEQKKELLTLPGNIEGIL